MPNRERRDKKCGRRKGFNLSPASLDRLHGTTERLTRRIICPISRFRNPPRNNPIGHIASLPLRPIAGNMTARGTDRRAPGAQCDAGQMDPANGRIFQSGCVYGVLLRSSLSARPQDLRAYRKVVVRIGVSAHRRDDRNAKTHTSASLSRSVPRLPDKPPKCLLTF